MTRRVEIEGEGSTASSEGAEGRGPLRAAAVVEHDCDIAADAVADIGRLSWAVEACPA